MSHDRMVWLLELLSSKLDIPEPSLHILFLPLSCLVVNFTCGGQPAQLYNLPRYTASASGCAIGSISPQNDRKYGLSPMPFRHLTGAKWQTTRKKRTRLLPQPATWMVAGKFVSKERRPSKVPSSLAAMESLGWYTVRYRFPFCPAWEIHPKTNPANVSVSHES